MLLPSHLRPFSLKTNPRGEQIAQILQAAIDAVDPGTAINKHLSRVGDSLFIGGRSYNLNEFQRLFIVGAGKAVAPMAQTVAGLIADKLTAGTIIVKQDYARNSLTLNPSIWKVMEAGHPIPDERSVQATSAVIQLLQKVEPDDLVIALISGGGSALLAAPVEGVTLADLQVLTNVLLANGASIQEINILRKHLDVLKGGGLAQLIAPASLITLILSDVVGSPLDIIASGPTVADSSSFNDAYETLKRRHLLDQVPESIVNHLKRGRSGLITETPKPGDPIFQNVLNVIIGSNLLAANAARAQAEAEGFNTQLLTTYLEGEARYVGSTLAAIARQISATGQPIPPPACIITGGETTVTIHGDGSGGRNQELALGAVTTLADAENALLITLATDGEDGLTNAAGAVVSGGTLQRAAELGLHPHEYLARNDSYHFFEALDDLLITGPTQTNVNDLTFMFVLD